MSSSYDHGFDAGKESAENGDSCTIGADILSVFEGIGGGAEESGDFAEGYQDGVDSVPEDSSNSSWF